MPNLISQDLVSQPIELQNTDYAWDDWQYGGYNELLEEVKGKHL